MLEYHADPGAILAQAHARSARPLPDRRLFVIKLPAGRFDEKIEAAQQRRLAGTARPENAYFFTTPDTEVDPVQHLPAPEELVNSARFQQQGLFSTVLRHVPFQLL